MVKEIKLDKGKIAIIDDEDYAYIVRFKWHAHYSKLANQYYAEGRFYKGYYSGIYKSMHRLIMNAQKGEVVDHINHDTLDNRKCNLRICTHQENCMNRKIHTTNKSGYKGVSKEASKQKYRSIIYANNKSTHLGYFTSKIEAALVYDENAEKYFGEFARLNFPEYKEDKEKLKEWLIYNQIAPIPVLR